MTQREEGFLYLPPAVPFMEQGQVVPPSPWDDEVYIGLDSGTSLDHAEETVTPSSQTPADRYDLGSRGAICKLDGGRGENQRQDSMKRKKG